LTKPSVDRKPNADRKQSSLPAASTNGKRSQSISARNTNGKRPGLAPANSNGKPLGAATAHSNRKVRAADTYGKAVGKLNGTGQPTRQIVKKRRTRISGAKRLSSKSTLARQLPGLAFELTAQQTKAWSSATTTGDLNELVEQRQLRPAAASEAKSGRFNRIISMIEAGQQPTADMIKRYIPGDLQRLIAKKVLGKWAQLIGA
jgi:hypothetical protein